MGGPCARGLAVQQPGSEEENEEEAHVDSRVHLRRLPARSVCRPAWRSRAIGRYAPAMADEALRALERRFLETGSVTDEADYLKARVRAGDLAPQRLELAAALENPAARLALGIAPRRFSTVALWHGIEKGIVVRMAVGVALNHELTVRQGNFYDSPEEAQRRADAGMAALKAAEAWVRCPCEPHRAASHRAAAISDSLGWFRTNDVSYGVTAPDDRAESVAVEAAWIAAEADLRKATGRLMSLLEREGCPAASALPAIWAEVLVGARSGASGASPLTPDR